MVSATFQYSSRRNGDCQGRKYHQLYVATCKGNPGNDVLVRVVKVRTKIGEKLHPITELCPLPLETLRQDIQMITTLQRPHPQLLRRAHISNFIRSVCNNSGIDIVLTTFLVQFIKTELSEETLIFRFSLPITSQNVYSRCSVIDGKRIR